MATLTRPPLRPIGVVDENQYGTLIADVYEIIPDLIYPHSVDVYAQMRRDSRLAAVLAGYTLQLRRAQWQLDGTGCRPEVVQLVADSMGLPIAGRDEPTGLRRRGVSWDGHLRAALHFLTFGHYAFELVAEIGDDGKARLAALAERIPQSISGIHADPKTGDLLGVDQAAVTGMGAPQIPAERLVWYCHEREGSAWQGVSLLRPSYAAWLTKREMIRVAAISHRRWGAGVPVMEAEPGTNPTPAQMAEAQRMASAARAGDQSGAAAPPGFRLRVLGLSGSVPDTLAFLEFLNREMASSVLMPHLDLGQGGNGGSRALGATFVDSWMLALESIAENVADTATRQIAERIVSWNWGDDEPVPAVTVSGVGSRREVTAESLQLLLSSGALSADPGLEAWVRREYRLPERVGPEPSARTATRRRPAADRTPDTNPDEPDDGEDEGEPSEEEMRVEAAATPPQDAERLAADHRQATDAAAREWSTASSALVAALAAATAAEVASGMLVGLAAVQIPQGITASLSAGLAARMIRLGEQSARRAAREARTAVGVDVDAGLPDDVRDYLTRVAQTTVGLIVNGYAAGAAREALRLVGPEVDAEEVEETVREHLAELSEARNRGFVRGHLSAAMATAQAAGREAVFDRLPEGTRYAVSEVNDRNRCGPCARADGRIYDSLADALRDYPAGKYRRCLGGDRCRGFLYPIPPEGGR